MTMNCKDISEDTAETIIQMLEHCLQNDICLGMRGGWILGEEEKDDKPDKTRKEIQDLIYSNQV